MNPTVDELLAQAAKLSLDDRELLLVRLHLDLDESTDPEVEAAWIAEAERRMEAIDRGESVTVPWEVVRKDLGLT
jgi:putative addiction module component (TIGR02574 family)